jgi:hypothetical protein
MERHVLGDAPSGTTNKLDKVYTLGIQMFCAEEQW